KIVDFPLHHTLPRSATQDKSHVSTEVISAYSISYMQKVEKMTKIIKFVYILIISLSLVVAMNINARGIPCYNKDVDCPENMCMYAHRPTCYLGFCKCVSIASDN
ncbi:hypothetical protein KIW84_031233, partial [Lathyrus oleraceus]